MRECGACARVAGPMLNELIQGVVAGWTVSCEVLCNAAVPNPTAKKACLVICELGGIDAFTKALSRVDTTPLSLCSDIGMCRHELCGPSPKQSKCLSIEDLAVTPPRGPAGTTEFHVSTTFVAQHDTGVGVTRFEIDNFQEGGGGTVNSDVDVLNDGFKAGDRRTVTSVADTREYRQQWVVGQYFATVYLCSFDCGDKRAAIYDLRFVDFNVTRV